MTETVQYKRQYRTPLLGGNTQCRMTSPLVIKTGNKAGIAEEAQSLTEMVQSSFRDSTIDNLHINQQRLVTNFGMTVSLNAEFELVSGKLPGDYHRKIVPFLRHGTPVAPAP